MVPAPSLNDEVATRMAGSPVKESVSSRLTPCPDVVGTYIYIDRGQKEHLGLFGIVAKNQDRHVHFEACAGHVSHILARARSEREVGDAGGRTENSANSH